MLNCKAILSTLIFLIITFSVIGQTLSNKSVEELNAMQKEAVKGENYELATKIKKELKTRVTIDEKIAIKTKELNAAAAIEDYDKADRLQKEIEKLKANKLKIETLKKEKETAITTEDYDRVIAIDKEIKSLKHLRKINDRPLSTEKEIDFVINYYENELLEFDKSNGKYKIFNQTQKESTIKSFKKAISYSQDSKKRIGSFTQEEENGTHYGFLVILRLSKDNNLITKYHQYYLTKVSKNTSYTYEEKINMTLAYHYKSLESLDKKSDYYEASLKAKESIIEKTSGYLEKINSLSDLDKKLINIYFDSVIFTSGAELDKETIDRFFKL